MHYIRGGVYEAQTEDYINFDYVCVVAISDGNKALWGKKRKLPLNEIRDVTVVAPTDICQLVNSIDIILVASSHYGEIYGQLRELDIPADKIVHCEEIPERYRHIFVQNFYWKQGMYMIENLPINLGNECQLPIYQKKAPMYDKFVKYLGLMEDETAARKEGTGYILDIGANVGDTLFALLNNTHSKIVSIEPSKEYYSLLKENVRKLDTQLSGRVLTVNAFISVDKDISYVAKMYGGTAVKSIAAGEAEAPTKTIKALLEEAGIRDEEITLIKVDTDGYDYDCIMSCGDILKIQMPLLYWENYVATLEQAEKYKEMAQYLSECGYKSFFVFDNFGNYMGEMNVDNVKELNSYLMRINAGYSTRTLYYLDILACKCPDRDTCVRNIQSYLGNYPEQRFI